MPPDIETLEKLVKELQAELETIRKENKEFRDENVSLRQKLGIRRFLTPTSASSTPMETQPSETIESQSGNAQVKNEKKPPPFFVQGINSLKVFKNMLATVGLIPEEIKALTSGDLKVVVKTADDYRKLRHALVEVSSRPDAEKHEIGSIKFHTYRLPEDKPFTVFIRGLHHSTDVEDIKSELADAGHSVINLINVQIKKKMNDKVKKIPLPLFKIDVSVNEKNRSLFDIRKLCGCTVTVEMPRKTTSLPQCTRCQDYGHTKNYCSRNPRCVKCGGAHLFNECRTTKSTSPKCANCGDKHTANYKGCSYYQAKIADSKPAKKLLTAVDRIKQTPNVNSVTNANPTYAQVTAPARAVKKIQERSAVSADKLSPDPASSQIVELLNKLQVTQITLIEKLDKIEKRVASLEGEVPSPPRKKKQISK